MNNSQEVAKVIKDTAKEKGIAVGRMLEACDLSKNALSTMQSGGYLPRIENLAKIADYLGVSVDYLLGREIKNAPDEDVRGDIIERIRSLSEADAERLRILVETVFPDQGGE